MLSSPPASEQSNNGIPLETLLMRVFISVIEHQWVSGCWVVVQLTDSADSPALGFGHGQRHMSARFYSQNVSLRLLVFTLVAVRDGFSHSLDGII